MSDFGNRIRKLEQERAAGAVGLLARLLRAFSRTGTIRGAVTVLEQEDGRPLKADPAFLQRAERTAVSMREYLRGMEQATDGTAREAGQP